MWPNFFTGFPFPFPTLGRANFNTLPTVAVTVGTENVTLELPNHAFRNRDYVGGFYINPPSGDTRRNDRNASRSHRDERGHETSAGLQQRAGDGREYRRYGDL